MVALAGKPKVIKAVKISNDVLRVIGDYEKQSRKWYAQKSSLELNHIKKIDSWSYYFSEIF